MIHASKAGRLRVVFLVSLVFMMAGTLTLPHHLSASTLPMEQASTTSQRQQAPAQQAPRPDFRTPQGISLQDYFQRANKRHYNGDYQGAMADYETIVRYGVVDASLFYNLANTYAMTDRIGAAILYYDKAMALEPRAKDLRHNLHLAEQQAAEKRSIQLVEGRFKSAPDSEAEFWLKVVRLLSPIELTILFVITHIFFHALLFLRRRYRDADTARTLFTSGAVAIGLILLLTTGLIFADLHVRRHIHMGVVTGPSAIQVYDGPTASSRVLFRISEGQRVRLSNDQVGDWVRIRLNPEMQGWTRRDQVGSSKL